MTRSPNTMIVIDSAMMFLNDKPVETVITDMVRCGWDIIAVEERYPFTFFLTNASGDDGARVYRVGAAVCVGMSDDQYKTICEKGGRCYDHRDTDGTCEYGCLS